jgi:hypothetical protein
MLSASGSCRSRTSYPRLWEQWFCSEPVKQAGRRSTSALGHAGFLPLRRSVVSQAVHDRATRDKHIAQIHPQRYGDQVVERILIRAQGRRWASPSQGHDSPNRWNHDQHVAGRAPRAPLQNPLPAPREDPLLGPLIGFCDKRI